MTEKIKGQSEISVQNEENEGRWLLKSTPFIVIDISFERFCTAGILSECTLDMRVIWVIND